jgi:hypothetical protein
MFAVDEASAEAIRRAFNESGELAAAVELRRRFPGIIDNKKAAMCARAIAGWQPLPPAKGLPGKPGSSTGRRNSGGFGDSRP